MVGKQRRRVEHTEQSKLVGMIRAFHPGVVVAAIPNGGGRTPQERVSLHAEGVLAGMPDLCVLKPSKGFCGLFLEMKTRDGIESAAQRDVARRLNREGCLCLVARSSEDAFKIVTDYLMEESTSERAA